MIKYEIFEIEKDHFIKVLKCSGDETKSSEQANAERGERKTIIVLIPGNPGIIEFYEQLATELNRLTNLPVVGISHTGHLYDKTIRSWSPLNLTNQIENKLKFIREHILTAEDGTNKELDIIFIGHSIGCYIILEVLSFLNNDLKRRIKKSILLFPTIERMSETPNGRVLTFMTNFFLRFIYFVVLLLSFLPSFVQKLLVRFLFTRRHDANEIGHNFSDVVLKMSTNFSCVRSCLHMGHQEMQHVKSLDRNLINVHLDQLIFYYGTKDKWCPLEYYYDIKDYVSSLEETKRSGSHSDDAKHRVKKHIPTLVLDSHSLDHAFVIYKKQCSILSGMVADWINEIK